MACVKDVENDDKIPRNRNISKSDPLRFTGFISRFGRRFFEGALRGANTRRAFLFATRAPAPPLPQSPEEGSCSVYSSPANFRTLLQR